MECYNDANPNPEESDGTTTLFSFLDVNFPTFFFLVLFKRLFVVDQIVRSSLSLSLSLSFSSVTGPEAMDDQVRDLPGNARLERVSYYNPMEGGVPSSLRNRITDNNFKQVKANGEHYDIITIEYKHFDS